MNGSNEVKEFLEKQNEEIKNLIVPLQISYWNATLSGKKEDYEDYEKKTVAVQKYLNNKENFGKIKALLKTATDEIEKRQLELLYNDYLSCQGDPKLLEKITKISTEIEHRFNTFRVNLDGKEVTDNNLKQILKTETDSEKLRQAWEASKKQGEIVEKELLELIKLRNKLAKSLGFKNYYVMSLELSEQKEEEIEKIFLELEKVTEESFKKVKEEADAFLSKRYGIRKEEMSPWHYQDLFFQEAPKVYDVDLDKFYSISILRIAEDFYEKVSLDVKDILERSDLYEKQGKYQHAYCIDINRNGDVRIMENIKDNEKWMETTLHELGHAVDFKHRDRNLPFLLRTEAHIFVTESMALLFGRNSKNVSFIKRYCNISDEEAQKIREEVKKQLKLDELVFLKWAMVMFNFERELYANPEQDLNRLWWNLIKKYQKIDFYRDKPDWASKIHFVSSPVYYHNYILGKLLASQVNNAIVSQILKGNDFLNPNYASPEIGNFLKQKIFSYGRRYRWNILIEKSFGEALNPKYFIRDYCS